MKQRLIESQICVGKMKYRKGDGDKILLSLDRGDLINKTFEDFSKDNKIVFAWLNGIGAIEDPEVGFYCIDEKSYHRKQFHPRLLNRNKMPFRQDLRRHDDL